jgi:hypothetical protein
VTCAVGLACLAATIVACYGGVLFGGGQFAFRDAAHFYYPLFRRVQQEWSAGRLPLWEPGENGGTPMLGRPMAAVLYPGKIVFAMVPYAWGVRLYTVAHEVLAFAAMVALTRSWGVSRAGAAIAGLGYAFGGPVLSGYANIIYLVGAAWAPLGLRAADRWLRLGRRSAMAELAAVLAMQVLGGDPEAAYLTGLCAFGYAVALARPPVAAPARPWAWGSGLLAAVLAWAWAGPAVTSRLRGAGERSGPLLLATAWAVGVLAYAASRRREHRGRLVAMLLGLALSGLLALLLAGAQVLPTLEQVVTNVRWAGGGAGELYEFSLLPHRAAEWIWPNVFGTFFAGNRHWISLLSPARAPRPWALSLYGGALSLLLASGAAGFRGGPPWRGWMSAIALVTFWAALGEFAGPARWTAAGPSAAVGDDSLYGLLATILPGFRLFRYPGKLLVFTSLAMSAMAGAGWDRFAADAGRRRVLAVTIGLVVVSVLALAAAFVLRDRLVARMAAARVSSRGVFGPFDAAGAVADLLRGLGHGTIALGLSLVVVAWSARRPGPAGLAAIVLLAVDLAAAHARLVVAIPQAEFEREPDVLRAIRAAESEDASPAPFRVHRASPWVPIGWSESASTRRLQEVVAWEIDTLQPGFGLLHGIDYVLSDESETGRADYRRLFQPSLRPADDRAAAALGVEPGTRVLYQPRRSFDLWGARYFIVPSYPGDWTSENRGYAAFLDRAELIYPDPAALTGPGRRQERRRWLETRDVQVLRNKAAFPRAWVVHDARPIRPLDQAPPSAREALIERLRSADDLASPSSVDLGSAAYVETDDPAGLEPYLPGTGVDASELVSVRDEGPTRVVLEARLQRPGLIVLADIFDPGWRLTIDGRPAPILRANLLMRGAAVDRGMHTLSYTYEPASVRIGLWVSAAGLLALFGLVVWARARPVAREVGPDRG